MSTALDQIIRSMVNDGDSENSAPITPEQREQRIEDLQVRFNLMNVKHTFKEGDMVQWKPGLRNKKGNDGDVYVVMKVFDKVHYSGKDENGSPYYREPTHFILGEISRHDSEFVCYYMNANRFEPAV